MIFDLAGAVHVEKVKDRTNQTTDSIPWKTEMVLRGHIDIGVGHKSHTPTLSAARFVLLAFGHASPCGRRRVHREDLVVMVTVTPAPCHCLSRCRSRQPRCRRQTVTESGPSSCTFICLGLSGHHSEQDAKKEEKEKHPCRNSFYRHPRPEW